MILRNHPNMIDRWPPKQSLSGAYSGSDPLLISPALPEAAVLHRIADCPPYPLPTSPQGVILYTDQGRAVIMITDTNFRERLFHKLRESLGLSLREIGDLEVDF